MIKLVVFDLDGTLARLSKGISSSDVELLKMLEKKGITIAICSGKPTYYLCGFMRQVELEKPILVGENGAVIQFGVDLPPGRFEILPHEKAADDAISCIKKAIDKKYPHMWYQPNQVGLTPFPKTEEEFTWIQDYIEKKKLWGIDVYRHCDSYDIVPAGLNKKKGLEYLGRLLGIGPEETLAVGDGVNDYPMFEYAGISIGIQVEKKEKVDYNFETITEALRFLNNQFT